MQAAAARRRHELPAPYGVRGGGEVLGWGQASDGYNVAISHPEGSGSAAAMNLALRSARVAPQVPVTTEAMFASPSTGLAKLRRLIVAGR